MGAQAAARVNVLTLGHTLRTFNRNVQGFGGTFKSLRNTSMVPTNRQFIRGGVPEGVGLPKLLRGNVAGISDDAAAFFNNFEKTS